MDIFWPIKTGRTFFDVNTIFHLAFWVFMGSNFWYAKAYISKPNSLVVGVCGALVWEVAERFFERWFPQMFTHPESWYNSWLSDPLTALIGILLANYALEHWSF